MSTADFSHLPQPVRVAMQHLLETLVQTFPVPGDQSTAPPPARFPRQPLELLVLETLEAIAPMPVTPVQMTQLTGGPHEDVRQTLQALATLGTIQHLRAGYYCHGPGTPNRPPGKRGERREPPPEVQPPSARYAARIARIVAQGTRRETTASPPRGAQGDE